MTFEERIALKHLINQARLEREGIVQDGLLHGTLGCYRHHRCRCEDCRAAETAYRRKHRAQQLSPTGHPHNREKNECLRGHEFTPENTHYDRRGYRVCRACRRYYLARHRAKVAA